MPLPYKLMLSLLVAVVGSLVGWLELQGTQPHLSIAVGAIAAVMLFGLWAFPEAGGGKP